MFLLVGCDLNTNNFARETMYIFSITKVAAWVKLYQNMKRMVILHKYIISPLSQQAGVRYLALYI